jgi:hypothetical protein
MFSLIRGVIIKALFPLPWIKESISKSDWDIKGCDY